MRVEPTIPKIHVLVTTPFFAKVTLLPYCLIFPCATETTVYTVPDTGITLPVPYVFKLIGLRSGTTYIHTHILPVDSCWQYARGSFVRSIDLSLPVCCQLPAVLTTQYTDETQYADC